MQKNQDHVVDRIVVIDMIKRLTGEFLGTFCLVFCGTGAIIVHQETSGMITNAGIAMVFGLVVLVMILSFGHISGAHLNPAVTIALTVAGRFQRRNLFPYVITQLAGASVATPILKVLFPANRFLGGTIPAGSDFQSFLLEIILTFILMLVILTSTERKDHYLLIPAIAIGTTVGLEAFFAGPISGASMNPARSIAPALFSGHTSSLWLYIFGPLLGAIIAVFVFSILKTRINLEK